MLLILEGKEKIIVQLLDAGANKNLQDMFDKKPIELASNSKIKKYLSQYKK